MIRTLNDIFDANKNSAIYLDEDAHVIKANTKAKAHFESKECLVVHSRRIMAVGNTANIELTKELQQVIQSKRYNAVFVHNVATDLPCRLDIYPVADASIVLRGRTARLIVVIDRFSKPLHLRSEQFRNYFSLTQTELDVAVSVFHDTALIDHAQLYGVKVNTVRWTLGNVFSKTGVSSQSQLRTLTTIFSD